jgi:hypothetical protein
MLAACARAAAPASPGADVGSTSSAAAGVGSISLERGPCFGTCPVYAVTISRTGEVRFEGRRFVADTGVSTGAIPAARAESLFTELDRAGYFELADAYRMGEPGCGRYATDLPTIVTEARLGQRTKRVEHDRGCADAPRALTVREGRIDEVAGTRRWIGK